MKLKVTGIISVLLIALSLTACGGSNNETATEGTTEAVSQTETEETTEVTQQTTAAETTQATTETVTTEKVETTTKAPAANTASSGSTSASGSSAAASKTTNKHRVIPTPVKKELGITIKGNKILLNSNMAEVAPLLGTTTDYAEEKSDEFDGLEKTFTYDLVNIYTYPHSTGDYIDELEINDPAITTDTGLAPIGKNISEVKAVYGEPSFFDSSFYVYEQGDCYTYYSCENDIVKYWGVVVGYIR